MREDVVFVDVNVPMYAAGKPHVYKEACVWLLTEIADGRLPAAIDTEIIQEILYRYGSLRRWDIAVQMSISLMDMMPVVYSIQIVDMYTAVELAARYGPQGIKARDLIHAAVMQNNGLTQIVSTDKHFDQIEGIVRLDPQALFLERK